MFTSKQYRARAVEYGDLAKSSIGPNLRGEFQKLERRFAVLADNEQWLADNYQSNVNSAEQDRSNGMTLADEEEHVLRCLGAALIMQWNKLPTTLRREIFDNAGSMGKLLQTAALRGQIARFLDRHKENDENTAALSIRAETTSGDPSLQAASIARWDDDGGACRMSEQRRTSKRQKYRRSARVSNAAQEDSSCH